MLAALKLATVRKVAPQIRFDRAKTVPDLATLQAVITHRYHVATTYARTLKAACAVELCESQGPGRPRHRPANGAPHEALAPGRYGNAHGRRAREALDGARQEQGARDDLRDAPGARGRCWERSTESSEQLLARLQDWCHRAEASGIAPLAAFSYKLRRYA